MRLELSTPRSRVICSPTCLSQAGAPKLVKIIDEQGETMVWRSFNKTETISEFQNTYPFSLLKSLPDFLLFQKIKSNRKLKIPNGN